MIVWLNGPFGVGKTSVAAELARRMPRARVVDPERIGYVMKRTFWRSGDYQHVGLWRRLTTRAVKRAARRGPVIVPMTVVDPEVFAEVTIRARVFTLIGSRDVVMARIGGSEEARGFRLRNLDRCLAAFRTHDLGELVATDAQTPAEIADAIVERL